MSRERRQRARLVALAAMVLGALAVAAPSVAHASGTVTGPSITVDHSEVDDGQLIWVTVSGFTAGSVTLAVCGNEARRGAADCNMIESKGVRIQPELDQTVARFGISTPPADCPCIIRASSPNN